MVPQIGHRLSQESGRRIRTPAPPLTRLAPDLTDPMTANEALRLLALALGALEEAVEEGVMFVFLHADEEGPAEWQLRAGFDCVVGATWSAEAAQGITDRPAAVARAWAEHRTGQKTG